MHDSNMLPHRHLWSPFIKVIMIKDFTTVTLYLTYRNVGHLSFPYGIMWTTYAAMETNDDVPSLGQDVLLTKMVPANKPTYCGN